MGKIISITSSKGGVGKTSLTAIASASLLNYYGKKVAVIDIDPQQSIFNKRESELSVIEEAESRKVVSQITANDENWGIALTSIYSINLNEDWKSIRSKIESVSKDVDILFIDFPGSLTLHNNTKKLLTILDYLVIPVYVDENTLGSTAFFIDQLFQLKSKGDVHAELFCFFNRFSSNKNNSLFIRSSNELDTFKPRLTKLNAKVYENIGIERYSTITNYSGGQKAALMEWVDEIHSILT